MNTRSFIKHAVTDLLRPSEKAYAHCDIPCGIYDPHTAQLAAESVEKMMTLMADLQPGDDMAAYGNSFSRYVAVKEEHAEIIKHQVRIIWGDFMKPPDLETVPNLHDVVWNIMRLASTCKVGTNVADAQALRAAVDEFAEMFAKVKATR